MGHNLFVWSQNSFYRDVLFHPLHRTDCVPVMNEDGIIKEKGFCFVPALRTVNKTLQEKGWCYRSGRPKSSMGQPKSHPISARCCTGNPVSCVWPVPVCDTRACPWKYWSQQPSRQSELCCNQIKCCTMYPNSLCLSSDSQKSSRHLGFKFWTSEAHM